MLEKFLTVPEDEFCRLLRDAPPLERTDDGKREAYRYARVSTRPFAAYGNLTQLLSNLDTVE